MDSRTRFAIGGVSIVAASVAVICAVALTNSLALSETAGSSIDAAPVVVPSASVAEPAENPVPASTPTPTSRHTDTPDTPDTSDAPVAEVVPAPAPEVVTPRRDTSPSVEQPADTVEPPSEDDVIAEAESSGSWDSAREWAARLGWTEERIDAWIARLEQSHGSLSDGQRDGQRGDGQRDAPKDDSRVELGGSGNDPGDDSRRRHKDSATDRQVSAPETSADAYSRTDTTKRSAVTNSSQKRPAHAGANADRRSMKPGVGAKEDRSRNPSGRRD